MVNVRALKARMVELDLTLDDIADAIGKTYATARNKVNGITPFTVHEAEAVQELLGIGDDVFCFYFMSHSREARL